MHFIKKMLLLKLKLIKKQKEFHKLQIHKLQDLKRNNEKSLHFSMKSSTSFFKVINYSFQTKTIQKTCYKN